MTREFHSFISKEDYAYIFSKVEGVFQEEMEEMSYDMCQVSSVLAFGFTDRWMSSFISSSKKRKRCFGSMLVPIQLSGTSF